MTVLGEGLVLQVGRYGLFGPLAAGGMAEVHFGRLAGTGGFQKTIAIKRLLPHIAQNPEFRTMIYQEARIASRIRHPNVVQPLDVIATDDEVLLAMEYVHGEALSKLVTSARKKGEQVPPAVGMAITCEMLQGLHAAHEAKDEHGMPLGIVHRDVSPQNVIVGVDGVARVIDFGIAKAVTSTDSTLVGHVKGKLPYIAPEQFAGESATRSSDIYAAACIAWEVLVGRRLFDGDSDTAVAARILHAPVDPPSAYVEGVPPELDEIILRGLDRDSTRRFATAREMALAIEQVMPIATASTVGAWVEHLAANELRDRAEKLARVERTPFEYVEEPAPARKTIPSVDGFVMLDASQMSGAAPPMSNQAAAMMPNQTQVLPRGSRPSLHSTPTPPPSSMRPSWRDDVKPPPAGALRKPEIEIPNVAWLPQEAHKSITITKPRKINGTLMALIFLTFGAAAFFVALPSIVARGYEKSAAAQGLVLVIGHAEVSKNKVTLVDVQIRAPELPWFSAHATAIDIDLAGIDARAITLRGVDIAIDGTYAALEKDVERWRAVHRVGGEADDARHMPKLTVDGARITWKNALGNATTLTAENVVLEALGDEEVTRVTSPLVRVAAGSSLAGPFKLEVERNPLLTRAWFRFDPTGAKSASLTLTIETSGAMTLEANIPRSAAKELWISPSSGISEIALIMQAKLVPGKKGEGRVDATLLSDSGQEARFDVALGTSGNANGTTKTNAAPSSNDDQKFVVTDGTAQEGTQKLKPGGTLAFNETGIELAFYASCDARSDAPLVKAEFDSKSAHVDLAIAKDPKCVRGGK